MYICVHKYATYCLGRNANNLWDLPFHFVSKLCLTHQTKTPTTYNCSCFLRSQIKRGRKLATLVDSDFHSHHRAALSPQPSPIPKKLLPTPVACPPRPFLKVSGGEGVGRDSTTQGPGDPKKGLNRVNKIFNFFLTFRPDTKGPEVGVGHPPPSPGEGGYRH